MTIQMAVHPTNTSCVLYGYKTQLRRYFIRLLRIDQNYTAYQS